MNDIELNMATHALSVAKYCREHVEALSAAEKRLFSDGEVSIKVNLPTIDDCFADMDDQATHDAALKLVTAMRECMERRQKKHEQRAVECLIGAPEIADSTDF